MGDTLFVIGAGTYQVPIIVAARAAGWRVVAVDGNDAAPGLRLADRARVVSIRDASACLAVAQEFGASGVVSICTEVGVRSAAHVAHVMGLPGISPHAAAAATDKWIMRNAFRQHGLAVPEFRRAHTPEEAERAASDIGYPVVIKPPDSSGSRGVRKVDDARQLAEAFAAAKTHTHGPVLVEAFMDGVEATIEAMTFQGETRILAISDKEHLPFPACVSIGLNFPAYFDSAMHREIAVLVTRAVAALGIDNGPTHTEVIVTSTGPMLVETAARGGGYRLFSDIIPLVSGVDAVKATLDIALGRVPEIEPKFQRGAVLKFFAPQTFGVLRTVTGVERAKQVTGVVDVVIEVKPGESLKPITADGERPGYIIARGTTRNEALQAAGTAEQTVAFVVE